MTRRGAWFISGAVARNEISDGHINVVALTQILITLDFFIHRIIANNLNSFQQGVEEVKVLIFNVTFNNISIIS